MKKIETFFVLGTVAALLVLLNKYVFPGVKRNPYVKGAQSKIIAYSSDKQFEEARAANLSSQQSQSVPTIARELDLKLILKNGRWILEGPANYSIVNSDGKLLVVSRNSKDNLDYQVAIEGITTYYPINGATLLDIPADSQIENFRVYEQEDFLPIFGYHYVIEDSQEITGELTQIHLSQFEAQVKYATEEMGCRWFALGNLMENYVLKGKKVPTRACVLTVDDGHLDSYTNVFPLLQKYSVSATFYLITDLLGKGGYMIWEQVDELFQNGHEIGSHTLFGGGLVNTGWYQEQVGRKFTHTDLVNQVTGSKQKLEDRGYKVATFAYPLGEWDDEVVKVVSRSGYIASRDTSKDNEWRDRRPSTVSLDDDFVWHMYYYKPEQTTLEELEAALGYNTWWQFEEGYAVSSNWNNDVNVLAAVVPTETSYAMVVLPNYGDAIKSKFLVNSSGNFTIEIVGSTGETDESLYSYLHNIVVAIDGEPRRVWPGNGQSCVTVKDRYYCNYFVDVSLKEGAHTIEVISRNDGFVRLDKFRVFRILETQDAYNLTVTEYSSD